MAGFAGSGLLNGCTAPGSFYAQGHVCLLCPSMVKPRASPTYFSLSSDVFRTLRAIVKARTAEVKCALCPLLHGAFKRLADGRWAHMACLVMTPRVMISNIITKTGISISEVKRTWHHLGMKWYLNTCSVHPWCCFASMGQSVLRGFEFILRRRMPRDILFPPWRG